MIFEETESVELKERVIPDFAKEVVAFVNSHGGTIYVGVSDAGEVIGVENTATPQAKTEKMNCRRDSPKNMDSV